MYRLPAAFSVTAKGWANVAFTAGPPSPEKLPMEPVIPATVLKVPSGVTLRMRLFPTSAM